MVRVERPGVWCIAGPTLHDGAGENMNKVLPGQPRCSSKVEGQIHEAGDEPDDGGHKQDPKSVMKNLVSKFFSKLHAVHDGLRLTL